MIVCRLSESGVFFCHDRLGLASNGKRLLKEIEAHPHHFASSYYYRFIAEDLIRDSNEGKEYLIPCLRGILKGIENNSID